jgi:predicted dithiol-disulfide oxidoreductase (DUF899 family)
LRLKSPALRQLHIPGESAEYRAARNALLVGEMELLRQTGLDPLRNLLDLAPEGRGEFRPRLNHARARPPGTA